MNDILKALFATLVIMVIPIILANFYEDKEMLSNTSFYDTVILYYVIWISIKIDKKVD